MTTVRTKIDDIKHFCALVLGDACEQLPIRTRRDTEDGHHVSAVVLDEFDARVLFLPQLQVAIDGRRDDEVRAVFSSNFKVRTILLFPLEETDAPCDDHKVDYIAVHETLVIPVCARQMLEEESFMRENYDEGA